MKVQKSKKENGITLVAQVITIITLLILTGISIATLNGNNGLFSKTKQAKEKYSISEAKEKLTAKLMQLQTGVIDEEQRNATIEDIDKLINETSKYYDKEIEDVKDKKENKIVKISGYYFEVDSKLNIVGNIDISDLVQTDTTYKVNSVNGNIMNVTVNIKNELGIQKVIKPDNTDVVPVGSKEQIAIDYDVEDGKEYKFKVQLVESNEQKEYTLKAKLNDKPVIKQNESNAYPTLTEYGVELNKIVKIDYGENEDNYYSLDNGNSWDKYTEDGVKVKKEGNILAKSIVDGEITRETQENVTMQLANDALGLAAYDENDKTYVYKGGNNYLYVNDNMSGKKLNVYMTNVEYSTVTIIFLNSENIQISKINHTTKGAMYKSNIVIPDNTYKINFYLKTWNHEGNNYNSYIYDIDLSNEPQINKIGYYPEITENGIIPGYSMVKISYDETSIQRLYSLDGQTWKNYGDEEIKLELDQTVYAKGIDKNGKETRITSSYTSKLTDDALKSYAYDGNLNTYVQAHRTFGQETVVSTGGYMKVNRNVINKTIGITYSMTRWFKSKWRS